MAKRHCKGGVELSEEQIEREVAQSDEWWQPPPSFLMRALYVVVLVGGFVALVLALVLHG